MTPLDIVIIVICVLVVAAIAVGAIVRKKLGKPSGCCADCSKCHSCPSATRGPQTEGGEPPVADKGHGAGEFAHRAEPRACSPCECASCKLHCGTRADGAKTAPDAGGNPAKD